MRRQPTSLDDTYATIKVLVGQKPRQTVRMTVNQTAHPGSGQTNQRQQMLDRFVVTEPDRPIRLIHMGEIPGDPEARQAIMRRQLDP